MNNVNYGTGVMLFKLEIWILGRRDFANYDCAKLLACMAAAADQSPLAHYFSENDLRIGDFKLVLLSSTHFGGPFLRSLFHLFSRDCAFAACQGPDMPEWVCPLPHPVAPEHISYRHDR